MSRTWTTRSSAKRFAKKLKKLDPSFISSFCEFGNKSFDDIGDYMFMLEDFTKSGASILHVDTQCNNRWSKLFEIPVVHCRGNLTFASNHPEIRSIVDDWSWIGNRCYAPMCVDDIGNQSFIGSGCVVKEGVTIGDNVLVSAGQIVMEDLSSNTLYKKILDWKFMTMRKKMIK